MSAGFDLLLQRAEGLGFDGEAENLRALVVLQRPERASYSSLLKELELFAAREPEMATDARAVAGKLLLAMGRIETARGLLERSGETRRLPPARVRLWLGQSRLCAGDVAGALACLEPSALEGPAASWGWFLRAVALLAGGDALAAASDAERFAAAGHEAATFALRAAVTAARGNTEGALSWLDRAAQARPAQAWPWLLKGGLLRAADRPGEAQHAFAEAFKREPSGALAAEKARLWEHMGDLPQAVIEAATAVKMDPSREHRLLKARIHATWREYAAAAEECSRLLEQDPNDAEALFTRSKAWSTAGRLDLALSDAEHIPETELGPAGQGWLIQLLQLNDRGEQAERRIAAALAACGGKGPAAATALFYRGYGLGRAGRWQEAVAAWDAAIAQAGGGSFAQKLDFYRTIGCDMTSAAPAARGPAMLLAGLGIDPPFSATVEALRALRGCDLVFNNVTGEEIFELLRLFCRDVRPLAYHQINEEAAMADAMLTEARRGRPTGFVTRGHPIIYGGLGAELVRRCAAEGLSWRCLATLSSADTFVGRHGSDLHEPGFQILDTRALLATGGAPEPAAPLVVYMGDDMRQLPSQGFKSVDRQRWHVLSAVLLAAYGKDHSCLMFENRADEEPRRVALSALSAAQPRASASTILFVPRRG